MEAQWVSSKLSKAVTSKSSSPLTDATPLKESYSDKPEPSSGFSKKHLDVTSKQTSAKSKLKSKSSLQKNIMVVPSNQNKMNVMHSSRKTMATTPGWKKKFTTKEYCNTEPINTKKTEEALREAISIYKKQGLVQFPGAVLPNEKSITDFLEKIGRTRVSNQNVKVFGLNNMDFDLLHMDLNLAVANVFASFSSLSLAGEYRRNKTKFNFEIPRILAEFHFQLTDTPRQKSTSKSYNVKCSLEIQTIKIPSSFLNKLENDLSSDVAPRILRLLKEVYRTRETISQQIIISIIRPDIWYSYNYGEKGKLVYNVDDDKFVTHKTLRIHRIKINDMFNWQSAEIQDVSVDRNHINVTFEIILQNIFGMVKYGHEAWYTGISYYTTNFQISPIVLGLTIGREQSQVSFLHLTVEKVMENSNLIRANFSVESFNTHNANRIVDALNYEFQKHIIPSWKSLVEKGLSSVNWEELEPRLIYILKSNMPLF